jgi:hypothetical protein
MSSDGGASGVGCFLLLLLLLLLLVMEREDDIDGAAAAAASDAAPFSLDSSGANEGGGCQGIAGDRSCFVVEAERVGDCLLSSLLLLLTGLRTETGDFGFYSLVTAK